MSCICGYLHFTRDLQYESFYLSQYILQFIKYKYGLSLIIEQSRLDDKAKIFENGEAQGDYIKV